MKTTNYTHFSCIHGTTILTVEETTHPYESMCMEFDPGPCLDTITYQILIVNVTKRTIIEVPRKYSSMKDLYNAAKKWECPQKPELMKMLWKILIDITPYEELSAYQQERRDRENEVYPRADSKYIEKMSPDEIKEMINELLEEGAQNLNDWRMYNDPVPENYRSSMTHKVRHLRDILKERQN